MRTTHDSTADFHVSISLGSVDSVTDSERRRYVLIKETTLEMSEVLEKGCLSSGRGRWSLIRLRSKRGFSATSYMSAIGARRRFEAYSSSRHLLMLLLLLLLYQLTIKEK